MPDGDSILYLQYLTSNSECFRHSWDTVICASSSSYTKCDSEASSKTRTSKCSSTHCSTSTIDSHSVYKHTICSSRETSWRSPGGPYSPITNLTEYNISRRTWIWNIKCIQ